ncbi:hypothetical protein HPC38_01110 [Pasteurellaceae bacterium HPA106]|uniref:hypothetical protein n=1 Tax=Spirabiliibacterium pneumoniae TaxID=221400 RepID=UPI001AAC5459|nr:hypothetical protein [Spirabiliibacterium pneumoniae]MBE2895480.1 hypothetical protein [Spirabiliibacterium pneumoniae]
MESFTLVLSVFIGNELDCRWFGKNSQNLLNAPAKLKQRIVQLAEDVNHVSPFLRSSFDDFVVEQSSGHGMALVKFTIDDNHWYVSCKKADEREASRYVRNLLLRLLDDRDAFLAEVEEIKKRCE